MRSPSIDFSTTLAAAQVRARMVVDAAADCTSEQIGCWPDVVAQGQGRVVSGRKLPRKEAKRRGRLGGAATKARSIRRKWQAPEMADNLAIQASIYRDPKRSKEQNTARLDKELQALSPTTLWRLFNDK